MPKTVRALIVEDNAEMRFMLTQMLRNVSDAVHSAGSKTEALHLLAFGDYDFVLIDVGLRDGSGIDIIRAVRTDPHNRHRSVPILVVTGQNQLAIVRAAVDAGTDSFVAKPVSLQMLTEHVDRILNHRRPLIDAPNYYGPDRRRKDPGSYTGAERRKTATQAVEWL